MRILPVKTYTSVCYFKQSVLIFNKSVTVFTLIDVTEVLQDKNNNYHSFVVTKLFCFGGFYLPCFP